MVVFALYSAALAARLIQLQTVDAADYAELAAGIGQSARQSIAPIRGPILTRDGLILARDEAHWQISLPYGLLADDPAWIDQQARRLQRAAPTEGSRLSRAEAARQVREMVQHQWDSLAQLNGLTAGQLSELRERIVQRVERLRAAVEQRRGYSVRIREQDAWHALIEPLDYAEYLRLLPAMDTLPFARLTSGQHRAYRDGVAFAHVIGRLAEVDAEVIRDDPARADPLRAYRPGERYGVSGVERLAEQRLRGTRGYIEPARGAEALPARRTEPLDGLPVRLTIDSRLQKAIYADLAARVVAEAHAVGGAVVVLDLPTRELLACVSYPAYDPERFSVSAGQLLQDTLGRPLLWRAVSGQYPPGSIAKPALVAGAITDGIVTPGTLLQCNGYVQVGDRKWWNSTRRGLGPINASDAIKHSANTYMYQLALTWGTERLCRWYQRFGLGARPGTGLIEERAGVNPSPDWIAARRRPEAGDALNFSIGQGEVLLTPLHAGSMMAALLDGQLRPPTLLLDQPAPPGTPVGLSATARQTLRRAMDRVVNEPGGTAYRFARSSVVRIAGKTGTAQASRIRLAPGILHPPSLGDSKHAWFAGFAPAHQPRVVVVVFVEYGGGGGQVAGPLARRAFEHCVRFGYLDGHADKLEQWALPPVPSADGEPPEDATEPSPNLDQPIDPLSDLNNGSPD